MLLIVSESLNPSEPVNDVAREMSLALAYFRSPALLASQLASSSRCLLLLAEDDLTESVTQAIATPANVGVVIAADSKRIRQIGKSKVADFLVDLPNAEWIGSDFDYARLAKSARRCRRRMLKVSKPELEAAFDNFEFVIQYQPKVERGSDSDWLTREAEALVRWKHPQHGHMAPL
ncbi:MAG: hypothetical protein AAFX10_10820, partial [Pseudomonadota bacterium]